MAMEDGPFVNDFPFKTSIYKGFSMAMLNNQMVLLVAIGSLDHKWIDRSIKVAMKCCE